MSPRLPIGVETSTRLPRAGSDPPSASGNARVIGVQVVSLRASPSCFVPLVAAMALAGCVVAPDAGTTGAAGGRQGGSPRQHEGRRAGAVERAECRAGPQPAAGGAACARPGGAATGRAGHGGHAHGRHGGGAGGGGGGGRDHRGSAHRGGNRGSSLRGGEHPHPRLHFRPAAGPAGRLGAGHHAAAAGDAHGPRAVRARARRGWRPSCRTTSSATPWPTGCPVRRRPWAIRRPPSSAIRTGGNPPWTPPCGTCPILPTGAPRRTHRASTPPPLPLSRRRRQPLSPAPFDALLLAESGPPLGRVAGALPGYGVTPPDVQIIGPATWGARRRQSRRPGRGLVCRPRPLLPHRVRASVYGPLWRRTARPGRHRL